MHFNPNHPFRFRCGAGFCATWPIHSHTHQGLKRNQDLDFIVFNGHQLFLLLNVLLDTTDQPIAQLYSVHINSVDRSSVAIRSPFFSTSHRLRNWCSCPKELVLFLRCCINKIHQTVIERRSFHSRNTFLAFQLLLLRCLNFAFSLNQDYFKWEIRMRRFQMDKFALEFL